MNNKILPSSIIISIVQVHYTLLRLKKTYAWEISRDFPLEEDESGITTIRTENSHHLYRYLPCSKKIVFVHGTQYWAQRMYLIVTILSLNVLLSLPVTPIKNVVWIILQLPIGQLISYWKSKPRDQLVFRVQQIDRQWTVCLRSYWWSNLFNCEKNVVVKKRHVYFK